MPQTKFPLISRQSRSGAAALPTDITFYPVPEGTWWISVEYCQQALMEALEAAARARRSGVVEYNIGSRGLKRFTLKELEDHIMFWRRALQDALLGNTGSAIQTRRAAPCDV